MLFNYKVDKESLAMRKSDRAHLNLVVKVNMSSHGTNYDRVQPNKVNNEKNIAFLWSPCQRRKPGPSHPTNIRRPQINRGHATLCDLQSGEVRKPKERLRTGLHCRAPGIRDLTWIIQDMHGMPGKTLLGLRADGSSEFVLTSIFWWSDCSYVECYPCLRDTYTEIFGVMESLPPKWSRGKKTYSSH